MQDGDAYLSAGVDWVEVCLLLGWNIYVLKSILGVGKELLGEAEGGLVKSSLERGVLGSLEAHSPSEKILIFQSNR